jgi:predicted transcriptional regulator
LVRPGDGGGADARESRLSAVGIHQAHAAELKSPATRDAAVAAAEAGEHVTREEAETIIADAMQAERARPGICTASILMLKTLALTFTTLDRFDWFVVGLTLFWVALIFGICWCDGKSNDR